MSNNRVSQLIQQLRDAREMGDDDLAEQIRLDLFREFEIEMANGGRVGLQQGGLPTVSSILGLQSLQAGQTPSATPDLDALGLQSLLPPRPDLRAMTQQAGNPMNVPNPYNYGYGASADFGRRNLDALQYTGDSAFPMLQDIFGKDAGTLTQQELDDRLAAQKSGLSKTYQGQIDAKVAAMAEANKAKASAEAALRAQRQQSSTAASAAAADAAAAAKAQADAIAKLKADLAALQAAPPKIKEIIKYIPNPRPVGGSCFIAGTHVTMADGTAKNIEDIEIGEKLKGETRDNTVVKFDRPTLGERSLFAINDGEPFVTSEHPFKTSDGWKSIDPKETAKETDMSVEKLNVGDVLITDADQINVDKIEAHDGNSEDTVYNFILDGDNTYYADGYLVHNKRHGGGPGHGGCFVKGTMIEMADGSKKEITSIDVGEETKGGTVLTIMKFSPQSIYNYKGVKVSGSHWVIEDNQFIEVENSKRAVATDTVETVYCFKTSKNRIWVNGVEFGDFETGSDEDWAPHFEFVKQKLNEQLRETRK